jgi:hypothetical protein
MNYCKPIPGKWEQTTGCAMGVRLVRPSAASLNSLARILRQAQPLYKECCSILNYLEFGHGRECLPPAEDAAISSNSDPTNSQAAPIPLTVFEQRHRHGKRIV